MSARSRRAQSRSQDGFVGGAEMLLFGVLVFVIGTLVIVNVWGTIEAKLAVAGAAREAARAYAEADVFTDADALAIADAAARESLEASGRHPVAGSNYTITVDSTGAGAAFERCERVIVEVSYDVPTVRLPIGGDGWGGSLVTVRSRHTELVDPYRSGIPGLAQC